MIIYLCLAIALIAIDIILRIANFAHTEKLYRELRRQDLLQTTTELSEIKEAEDESWIDAADISDFMSDYDVED